MKQNGDRRIAKLRLCDVALLSLTVIILASSIQLEITGGNSPFWVWVHIVTGTLFLGGITWHCQLHFGNKGWLRKLGKRYKWLTAFFLLTSVSAVVATAHWLAVPVHSMPGAVHGKIGFIFLAIVIGHTARRFRFFMPKG